MGKHKKLTILLFSIEIILLGFIGFRWFTDSTLGKELDYWVIGFNLDDIDDWSMVYDEHRDWETNVLEVNYGDLEPGIYKLEVDYTVDDNQHAYVYVDGFSIPESYEGMVLDERKHNNTQYITNKVPAENFTVKFAYYGGMVYTIHDIRLYRSERTYLKLLFYVILIFSCLEFLCYCYFKDKSKLKRVAYFVSIAMLASLPLLVKGIHVGHDYTYHYARIEGIYREIMAGKFPVYFQSIWCDGYGSPVSMYYGDWLLYIPVALRLLGFPFVEAYKIFIFVITQATAVISFYSFKSIFKDERISFLTTFIYVLAPYRLIDVYVRTAVGEYCALMFMPLAIAGYYGIMESVGNADGEHKLIKLDSAALNKINMLAIGMAGLVTCHMLSTEITVFILVACTIVFIRRLNFSKIIAFLISIIEFIFLSLFFIVPFIDAFFSNDLNINHTIEENNYIQYYGIQIGELFAFFKGIFGEGKVFSEGFERMQLSLGIVLTISLVIAVYFIIKKKANTRLKIFTFLSLFTVFMATDVFPWNALVCYTSLGKILASIQFPWRFLTYATIFAAIVSADVILVILEDIREYSYSEKRIQSVFIFAVLAIVSFESVAFHSKYLNGYEPMYNASQVVDSRSPVEYLRYDTNVYAFADQVYGENIDILEIERNESTFQIYCKTAGQNGNLVIPMQNVKGFVAVDQSGNHLTIGDGINKEISVDVPANYEGYIEVRFEALWYWKMAFVVSGAFIALLLIFCAYKRNKGMKSKSVGA